MDKKPHWVQVFVVGLVVAGILIILPPDGLRLIIFLIYFQRVLLPLLGK